MLSDVNQLKTLLGINLLDNSQLPRLAALLAAADAGVKSYCKRDLETSLYVETRTGTGTQDLYLYQRPVLCYQFTGTLTSGSAVITSLTPTIGTSLIANLLVGMPVLVGASNSNLQAAIPANTTIQSISVLAGTVTMSQNATQNLTTKLTFGLAVWYDPGGLYGDGVTSGGVGPFAGPTQLYVGMDYVLLRDLPDGTSKSGVLKRIRGGIFGGAIGGFWGDALNLGQGTLTAPLAPYWPKNPPGAIKVVYAAGLGVGAVAGSLLSAGTSIPAELTMAVNMLAAWMYQNGERGGITAMSENYEDYSVSVGNLLGTNPDLGTVRQLLTRYRASSF